MDSEVVFRLSCKINRWIHGGRRTRQKRRKQLAAQYIRGEGLEIGALHSPLSLPEQARVRYVDRMSLPELRREYKELESKKLVEVDIVDNGEALCSIEDGSVDFVVANHLLEHCEDPIGSLSNWFRVTRKGGTVYMAVPDKRFTFEHKRPLTEFDHLLRDWQEGPQWSRMKHYEEWMSLVEGVPLSDVKKRARELASTDYSIHFHVWTPDTFKGFLEQCQKAMNPTFRIVDFIRNGNEMIAVLERTSTMGL